MLHPPANPAHLAWRDAHNLGRLHPTQLLRDQSRRVIARASRRTCRSMLSIVRHYREADIFKCL
jgi:hypothetical protein